MRENVRGFSALWCLFTLWRQWWKTERRKKKEKRKERAVGKHMLRPVLPSEASSVPGDANTQSDLCRALGKVNHLHCSHVPNAATNLCCVCRIQRMFSASICINHDLFVFVLPRRVSIWLKLSLLTSQNPTRNVQSAADVPGSGQMCRFCTLLETQHLSLSLTQYYSQHLSPLLSSVV